MAPKPMIAIEDWSAFCKWLFLGYVKNKTSLTAWATTGPKTSKQNTMRQRGKKGIPRQ